MKLSLLYPTPSPTVEPSWSGTHLVCPRRTDGGPPSFCLSRLSHRRSSTFKTSLVSDTIVRKGAVLRQLMRERPKSSSTEVHIKQKLLSVFYPLTNYTYSVSDSYRKVKGFLRKNSEVVWFFAEGPQSKNHTTLCFFIPFLSVSENTTKYHQVPYSFRYPPVGLVLTISSSTMKWFDSITSISITFTLHSSYPLPVTHTWVHLYISITTCVSSYH